VSLGAFYPFSRSHSDLHSSYQELYRWWVGLWRIAGGLEQLRCALCAAGVKESIGYQLLPCRGPSQAALAIQLLARLLLGGCTNTLSCPSPLHWPKSRHRPEVAAAGKRALGMRYKLLPYLYTAVHAAADTGAPIMRPLWFNFPQDKQAQRNDRRVLGRLLLCNWMGQGAAPWAVNCIVQTGVLGQVRRTP